MEKFNDILTNIKDRFTNPFVFSFICSWLISNWKITVALVWFEPEQLEKTNDTVFTFIEKNIDICNTFWYPLLFALAYIIINPISRNIIQAFNSWAYKWGEKWNLKILENGSISISKYLKLKKDNHQKSIDLMNIINSESKYIDEYRELQNNNNTLLKDYQDTRFEKLVAEEFIEKLNDNRIINGTWECKYTAEQHILLSENITILNGEYIIHIPPASRMTLYHIHNFHFNNKMQEVFFVKELVYPERDKTSKENHFLINRLRFEGNNMLVGTENSNQIEYTRR